MMQMIFSIHTYSVFFVLTAYTSMTFPIFYVCGVPILNFAPYP